MLESPSTETELQAARARAQALEARVRELEAGAAQQERYAADLRGTYSELRRSIGHLTALQEITTRVAAELDPDRISAALLDSLDSLLPFEAAAVYLVDMSVFHEQSSSRLVPSSGVPRLLQGKGERFEPDGAEAPVTPSPAVHEAIRTGTITTLPGDDGRVVVAVPLRIGASVLGVLGLWRAEGLTDEEVRLVGLLAAGVAVALQNGCLYQETRRLAVTDSLTGLSNYRHFWATLRHEVDRARRMGHRLGLLMIDLDHFKKVNDGYGHPVGDLVLRRIAELMRALLRRTDCLARPGGEEFAVILPNASIDEVRLVGEKLRLAARDLPPLEGGKPDAPSTITLSVGAVSLLAEELDADSLYAKADAALFAAKNGGRNQVRVWNDETGAPASDGGRDAGAVP